MPLSPSSSAQAARKAVAGRLRELRSRAGLTITELADRCGWHHSKTSRIENARTSPAAADILAWCRACGAADEAPDLITQSVNAASMYAEWRHQVRGGLTALQEDGNRLFRNTSTFRVYSTTLIPGLLQTHGYAAALLSGIADFRGVPDDSEAAAAARTGRARILHEPGRRFLLLIEEGVLRHQIGDTNVMAAQLGHLLSAGYLPSVSLGVIPSRTPARPFRPVETFHLYDRTLASVELVTAAVNITQPSEINLYLTAFERLRGIAVYGAQARALIADAIKALG
ncbi:helix-turn-helix domain-containing protein [Streptomyces xiamenensis]|uniref:helix-turn-helix domain-containing protein n=1 Tax=Streptomyces xiamenensis TaxID=408015 RepID=UPI0035DDC8D7